MSNGWGFAQWGAGQWGAGSGGAGDTFALLSALAIRENVVRLTFSEAPLFNTLLTANDAHNPERYDIVPVAGTFGSDELPTRPVRAVFAEVAAIAGSLGTIIDVTVDRPFSPYPSEYRISVNQLESISGALLDSTHTSATFIGVYRPMRVQSLTATVPSRDMANPQTYSGLVNAGVSNPDGAAQLGTFPIDPTGDYAFDDGLNQVKKRIIRRLVTRKGSFPSLPDYGVGVPSYGKRLGSAAVRQSIAADAQTQISAEPEVAEVSVNAITDATNPSITLLRIRVRLNGAAGSTQFDVPFSTVT